jgi:predicted extracellular nuclease
LRVGQALEVRRVVDTLFDANPGALIAICGDFNGEADEVPVEAIVGEVENTNNPALSQRVLVPCERSVPESARFTLYHRGQGNMLDHVLVSRSLLRHYQSAEIHNETLHDESVAFASDRIYPESDHAPVVATFTFG